MQSNHQKCPLKWLVNHLHQRLSAKNFQAHSKPETDKLRRDWMMNHQFLLEVRRIEKMIKVMMTKFSHIFQVLLSIFWHFISVHIYFTLSKVNVRFCIVCISSSWCSPKKSNGLLNATASERACCLRSNQSLQPQCVGVEEYFRITKH